MHCELYTKKGAQHSRRRRPSQGSAGLRREPYCKADKGTGQACPEHSILFQLLFVEFSANA